MTTTPNPPAFPFTCQGPTTAPEIYYGRTLRDYFAVHSYQPGTIEAYQLRGCPEVALPPGWSRDNFEGTHGMDVRASQWWRTLSLDEKYAVYAELRFKIADAMLAERNKEPAQ